MHFYCKLFFYVIAENIAKQWQITRQQQDEFALVSQHRTEEAQKSGIFNEEIVSVPVIVPKKGEASQDLVAGN